MSFDERDYVWGQILYEQMDGQYLIDIMRFESNQYNNLMKISLADMASDFHSDDILNVELVIALPTEDLTDENNF
ncbi:hypothetical protein [Bacillus sp. Bos-x628]|uniref:hypothetical protein n=1 Tax=Bacillus maqinnsis TaxID=3229854 RepID=UPI0033903E48